MINCAVIMGRLVADPELRTTTSGKSVTSFFYFPYHIFSCIEVYYCTSIVVQIAKVLGECKVVP